MIAEMHDHVSALPYGYDLPPLEEQVDRFFNAKLRPNPPPPPPTTPDVGAASSCPTPSGWPPFTWLPVIWIPVSWRFPTPLPVLYCGASCATVH